MNHFELYLTRSGIYLILFIFFFSCKGKKDEIEYIPLFIKDTVFLEGRKLSDELLFRATIDLGFYHDYLILVAFTEGKFMHVFDRNTGTYLKSFLAEGRGPAETVTLNAFDINQVTGKVTFYDDMLLKLCEFELDSVMKPKGKLMLKSQNSRLHATSGYIYQLRDSSYIEGNWFLRDKNGIIKRLARIKNEKVTCVYNRFPWVGREFQDNIHIAYRNTGILTVSPDRMKMASGGSWGAILEIFDLRDSIKLETIKYIHRPVYKASKSELYPVQGETVWGFKDLYATDRFIYALYWGNQSGKDGPDCIAVFDWQGELVKFYKTDHYLHNLCVDEDKNKIYAVGVDKKSRETVMVEFLLNELLLN